jgi:hypothetical protein
MENLKNLDWHARAEAQCLLILRESAGIVLFQEACVFNRSGKTPELSNRICGFLIHGDIPLSPVAKLGDPRPRELVRASPPRSKPSALANIVRTASQTFHARTSKTFIAQFNAKSKDVPALPNTTVEKLVRGQRGRRDVRERELTAQIHGEERLVVRHLLGRRWWLWMGIVAALAFLIGGASWSPHSGNSSFPPEFKQPELDSEGTPDVD